MSAEHVERAAEFWWEHLADVDESPVMDACFAEYGTDYFEDPLALAQDERMWARIARLCAETWPQRLREAADAADERAAAMESAAAETGETT